MASSVDVRTPDDERSLGERVEAFRASIAPDLHLPDVYIPWEDINAEMARLETAVVRLQALVDASTLDAGQLDGVLANEPGALDVLEYLLAAPQGAGFSDGRELPDEVPADSAERRAVADLMVDLRIAELLPPGSRVADGLRVALVWIDARRRRGIRRRETIEEMMNSVVERSIDEVEARTGVRLTQVPRAEQPEVVRGTVRAVLAADKTPVAVVATVLQSQSGGRQQRDLEFTYPRLQQELDAVPAVLILIADGRGVKRASRRVLADLIGGDVGALMTVSQAEAGQLADALQSAVVGRGLREIRQASLETLIESSLLRGQAVRSEDLPVAEGPALEAMSQFVVEHRDWALDLDPAAHELSWTDRKAVAEAYALSQAFEPATAVQVLSELLNLDVAEKLAGIPEVFMVLAEGPGDRIVPSTLPIAATRSEPADDVLRAVAKLSRQQRADAALAALLVEDTPAWRAYLRTQSSRSHLATSVVVLDTSALIALAGAESRRDAFVRLVLEQADLSKTNPFNYTGPTRPEMFFGREDEVETIRTTLLNNSAALMGGRRVGKTSLLQRTRLALEAEGWSPFYADCQEAANWKSFVAVVAPRWDVEVPSSFEPSHLATLVRQLSAKAAGQLILLLDEIDQLLRWDLSHSDGNAPEAFFRACRALSQEGAAQFVFSGERLVAERLWDPASPHWNFCRGIYVRQLTRKAAEALLSVPLEDLGVTIRDRQRFLDVSWDKSHGHPHIVQYLGDALVHLLNARDPTERAELAPADIQQVVATDDFRRRYLDTYWGQATRYERLITTVLAETGPTTTADLRSRLRSREVDANPEHVTRALQMLRLYGVVEDLEEPVTLRASWFPEALEAWAGVDDLLAAQAEEVA